MVVTQVGDGAGSPGRELRRKITVGWLCSCKGGEPGQNAAGTCRFGTYHQSPASLQNAHVRGAGCVVTGSLLPTAAGKGGRGDRLLIRCDGTGGRVGPGGADRRPAPAESGLDDPVIAPKKLMLLTWKDRFRLQPGGQQSQRQHRYSSCKGSRSPRVAASERARDRIAPDPVVRDSQAEDVSARDAACHTASQPGTNCVARSQARTRLSSRAMPCPAMSNAVPWSTDTRTTGSPIVMFTPASP